MNKSQTKHEQGQGQVQVFDFYFVGCVSSVDVTIHKAKLQITERLTPKL